MITELLAPEVVELAEWKKRELPGWSLHREDAALVEELRSSNRLLIDELRDGLRIQAKAWVGVVRLSNGLEIRVVPKLAGDQLGLVELIEYTRGLAALREHAGLRDIDARGAHLLDLIALLFVRECERIVAGGLLADYAEFEEEIPVLRGRLLIREQLQRCFGRPQLLVCRFDERDTDIFDNRLLAAAAEACSRRVADPEVKRRAGILREVLGEVCDWRALDLSDARTRRIEYDRLNDHYSGAHELAQIILQGLALDDLVAGGRTRSFAFLLSMNRLFEDFVEHVVRWALHGRVRVRAQRRDSSIIRDAETDRPYARIIPDLLVEGLGGLQRLAVDAKYKLYDGSKISVDDVSQSFLYAYAYASHSERPPAALLLFPSTSGRLTTTRLRIRSTGGLTRAAITGIAIPIPALLAEIKRQERGPLTGRVEEEVTVAAGLHAVEEMGAPGIEPGTSRV